MTIKIVALWGTPNDADAFEKEYAEIPIYADDRFTAGSEITGPAIVDATDTTIFVPPGTTARRDQFMNYVLTSNGASK